MKRLACLLLCLLMLWGCSSEPALRPGFYIPEDADSVMGMVYVELCEDGTGIVSVLGVSRPDLSWTKEGFDMYDVPAIPTDDGFAAGELRFRYTGDSLPEGYLPDPPQPGTYYISSVSCGGDLSILGAPDPEKNGLTLNADGTGCLNFDGEAYDLTWDGSLAEIEGGWYLSLVDMGDQGEDPPLVMAYVMEAECPIEADSIALRLLEGE